MATATLERTEKTSRMDIRLTDLQRSRYERAAALRGQTLTQWASSHLDACASRDIAEASTTVLSPEAFDEFCALLEAPMPKEAAELLERKPIWQ